MKEYKVLEKAIIGVRREESSARAKRYKEPTACRYYGSKKEYVEQIYPILDWTSRDVKMFLDDRKIKVAPIYYNQDGDWDENRRLGCMCCPLASHKIRIEQFRKDPRIIKLYLRAGRKYLKTHPDCKISSYIEDEYQYFYAFVIAQSLNEFLLTKNTLFGRMDYKSELERIFRADLTI